MNPKPFSLLNHFTVPCAIAVLLQESRVARAHRVRGVVFADDGSRRSWKATNATATNPASRIQPNKELLTTNYHGNRLSAAPRVVPWLPSGAARWRDGPKPLITPCSRFTAVRPAGAGGAAHRQTGPTGHSRLGDPGSGTARVNHRRRASAREA